MLPTHTGSGLHSSLFAGILILAFYSIQMTAKIIIIILYLAMLQCLAFSGLRSFSQEQLQKIQFNTPLTLIWGKNSSGKTTILESLRYMIGGVLPRKSNQGRLFVTSSRQLSSSIINADIRLKLRTANEQPILARRKACIRINNNNPGKMQSSSNRIKTVNEEGKIFQIKPTSIEMDRILLRYIGSSRPIVEHVLFCQELLWPFQRPHIFRQIFEEMPQIKRLMQIKQAFQSQKQQYQQQIENMSMVLGYQQRLFKQANKKKIEALVTMQKISQQSSNLTKSASSFNCRPKRVVKSKFQIKTAMLDKCKYFLQEAEQNLLRIAQQYFIQFRKEIGKQGSFKQRQEQIETLQIKVQQKIDRQDSQLASINKELRRLQLQRDYLRLLKKRNSFVIDMEGFEKELGSMKEGKVEHDQLDSFNEAKQEYQHKKRQINLRAQIAFQEYQRPFQKSFLFTKAEQSIKKNAVKDLQNFCNAIEDSIKIFQMKKIQEINLILSELWNKVYKDSDIKSIKIESQKQRKSKYSTVFECTNSKQCSKIMDGYCSMSQKIVASVIIRIAIARVFSPHSCIIALDDPTAFLDRQNTRNLAEHLKRTVQMNEIQSLQLIVASHDKQFIEYFECPTWYEVRREDRVSKINKIVSTQHIQ